MTISESTWTPSSWRSFPAGQQPEWPDPDALAAARDRLRALPPLVFAGEARALLAALGEVCEGRAFLLQAGDCVESFREISAPGIREKLKVLLQMSAVLTYGATLPVVRVGRIAGQFAKPRTSATEVVDGVELPSFRGHVVHSDAPTAEARVPDPERLVHGYYQAASTLNLLRAFTKGGFADLSLVHTWNREFVAGSPSGQRYEALAGEIGRALRFMQAIGIDLEREPTLHEVDVWTSHEGLLLDYEEPLTRTDSLTGEPYDCSAHMLWIGDRTRELDGAHVEFFSGIRNPIGVKLGPTATPEGVCALAERLNPDRVPGRLTLITRMGAEHVRDLLPPLLKAVREAEIPVVWACDPMHANLVRTPSGTKTRHFDSIMAEVQGFFASHREVGDVARRRPHRVHRGRRHRVPRRLDRGARGATRPPLRDALRPAPERPPVARSRVPRRRAHASRLAPRACGSRSSAPVSSARPRVWLPTAPGSRPSQAGTRTRGARGRGRAGSRDAGGVARGRPPRGGARLRRRSGGVGARRSSTTCSRSRRTTATVTDAGSTKASVCQAAGDDPRFVGGHPICGAEARGPARASTDLFEGATWFLTPLPTTEPARYRAAHAFAAALGARPLAIDPGTHDRLVAVTSHLPHALANVLLNQAGSSRIDGHDPLSAAGGSLRDMTRVAGANPRIWVDIFLDNRVALAQALAEHRRRVEQLETALGDGDAGFLARWIGEASENRREMLDTAYEDAGALHRLRVHVPDRPGVLAGIFQALGAERLNVNDFELEHLSSDRGGTLTILVTGENEAAQAARLLEAQGYSVVAAPVLDE